MEMEVGVVRFYHNHGLITFLGHHFKIYSFPGVWIGGEAFLKFNINLALPVCLAKRASAAVSGIGLHNID